MNKQSSPEVQRSKPVRFTMKKLMFAVALAVLFSPFVPQAKSQDVSVDFFYNNLNGGSWIEVGDYGYCWQPDVAVADSTWRPYADGYWAYTDDGWTWISYEDFGWATYHYGRWVRLTDVGWVWKPGYEWGPAWVSWRTGGNYIGWAPLPPETEVVYESRPLSGHLDIEFDIGPGYYNFIDVRYIGEPVLRSRIVPYEQNVTYINQTVNVTNITYKNKTVYNYGPDLNVVNQYSSRPIQRLKLERQTNVDVSAAARSGNLFKPQGNALVVAAPEKINKAAKEIAPPSVKTKVAQPKVEKGWAIAGDANAQTQLKEKIKSQNLKNVPPPTLGGGAAAAAGASSSVAPGTSLAPGIAPVEREKKKGKGAEQFQAGAAATAAGAAGAPTTGPAFPEKGKRKGKFGEQEPGAVTSPAVGTRTEMSPGNVPVTGRQGKGNARRAEQFGGTPGSTGSATSPEGMMTAPERKPQGNTENFGAAGGGTTPQGISDEPRGVKQKKRFEQQQQGPPPSSQSGAPGAPSDASMGPQGGPAGGEGRGQRRVEQPAAAGEQPTGGGQQGGERKHEGKKKGGPESPAPTPQ
jgi:hypothetical protein